MKQFLFSYGTLQLEKVQLELFGRKFLGKYSRLLKYKLEKIEIHDKEVLAKSNKKHHPIAIFTGNETDFIDGVIFEVTKKELKLSDSYEVFEYERIVENFENYNQAWVYVCRTTNQTRK